MTTNEIVAYYTNLLILQYHDKPKAKATVDAVVRPVIMDQLPISVQDAYAIDTAVGKQLDVIAKYVGVTRSASGLGMSVTLADSDFRQLIKFAIVINNGDSTMYDIVGAFYDFFSTNIYVTDHQTMRMSFLVDNNVGSIDLIKSILIQGLIPRPMGVRTTLIYNAEILFFGMRTYQAPQPNARPFNSYATSPQPTWSWLSYSMTL